MVRAWSGKTARATRTTSAAPGACPRRPGAVDPQHPRSGVGAARHGSAGHETRIVAGTDELPTEGYPDEPQHQHQARVMWAWVCEHDLLVAALMLFGWAAVMVLLPAMIHVTRPQRDRGTR